MKLTSIRTSVSQSLLALRFWSWRQVFVAGGVALGVGLLIGVATVLIPNSFFARDIEPVWWNYPVWILTALGSGLLAATYVQTGAPGGKSNGLEQHATDAGVDGAEEQSDQKRAGRLGIIGTFLTWFAVGCPVCNKIALLALGYSGAITWFAPVQPYLGLGALVLLMIAVIWRLKGQVACPVQARSALQKQSV